MKSYPIVFLLITLLVVPAGSVQAGICFFGYADAYVGSDPDPLERFDSMISQVQTSGGRVVVDDENDYIVDDVDYIIARSGRVILDLTDLIFNPTGFSGIDCRHYERGTASDSALYYKFRGNYKARLATFVSLNAALFTGNDKVIGVVIHSEANGGCVEDWKLNSAAAYFRDPVNGLGLDPAIRLIVGYGLDNTPGQVGRGLPVTANGSAKQFPANVDTIAYFVYDVYDPRNPAHPSNKNADPWDLLWGKVTSRLGGRSVIAVLNAHCEERLHENILGWVDNCPNQKVWVLGYVARFWKEWWLNEPHHIGVIGWLWGEPVPAGQYYGTRHLTSDFVRAEHQAINTARNCLLPLIP